jgi:hypothetical protein
MNYFGNPVAKDRKMKQSRKLGRLNFSLSTIVVDRLCATLF